MFCSILYMKGLVKSLFNNEMLPSVRSVPAGAMSLTACRRGLMFGVAGEGTGRDDGLLLSASRRYAAPRPVARCLFLSDLGGGGGQARIASTRCRAAMKASTSSRVL